LSTLETRLEQIIKDSGVSHRESSQSFIFECPRCRKKDKLYLRKTNGRFICFVCAGDGFQGRPEYALKELLDLSIAHLQKLLYGTVSPDQLEELILDFEDHWGEEEELLLDFEAEPRGICADPNHVGPEDPAFEPGRDYLKKRGVTEDIILRYGILFSPPEQRVIFPICHGDLLMGYQGRYIHDTEIVNPNGEITRRIPKAMTFLTPGQEGRLVIFEHRLRDAAHAVITEGPFDALAADLCGGNVATMGRNVTAAQMRLIALRTNKLFIGLDPDAAQDISRLARDHGDDFETYLLQPPRGRKDLGECTPAEVLDAFHAAPRITGGSLIISLGSSLVHL